MAGTQPYQPIGNSNQQSLPSFNTLQSAPGLVQSQPALQQSQPDLVQTEHVQQHNPSSWLQSQSSVVQNQSQPVLQGQSQREQIQTTQGYQQSCQTGQLSAAAAWNNSIQSWVTSNYNTTSFDQGFPQGQQLQAQGNQQNCQPVQSSATAAWNNSVQSWVRSNDNSSTFNSIFGHSQPCLQGVPQGQQLQALGNQQNCHTGQSSAAVAWNNSVQSWVRSNDNSSTFNSIFGHSQPGLQGVPQGQQLQAQGNQQNCHTGQSSAAVAWNNSVQSWVTSNYNTTSFNQAPQRYFQMSQVQCNKVINQQHSSQQVSTVQTGPAVNSQNLNQAGQQQCNQTQYYVQINPNQTSQCHPAGQPQQSQIRPQTSLSVPQTMVIGPQGLLIRPRAALPSRAQIMPNEPQGVPNRPQVLPSAPQGLPNGPQGVLSAIEALGNASRAKHRNIQPKPAHTASFLPQVTQAVYTAPQMAPRPAHTSAQLGQKHIDILQLPVRPVITPLIPVKKPAGKKEQKKAGHDVFDPQQAIDAQQTIEPQQPIEVQKPKEPCPVSQSQLVQECLQPQQAQQLLQPLLPLLPQHLIQLQQPIEAEPVQVLLQPSPPRQLLQPSVPLPPQQPSDPIIAANIALVKAKQKQSKAAFSLPLPKIPFSSFYQKQGGDNIGCMECPRLGMSFVCRKRRTMVRHVKMEHLKYGFACKECNRLFKSRLTLERHHIRLHPSPNMPPLFSCALCNDYSTSRPIVAHMHKVKCARERGFPCPECEVPFYSIEEMAEHRAEVHLFEVCDTVPVPCSTVIEQSREVDTVQQLEENSLIEQYSVVHEETRRALVHEQVSEVPAPPAIVQQSERVVDKGRKRAHDQLVKKSVRNLFKKKLKMVQERKESAEIGIQIVENSAVSLESGAAVMKTPSIPPLAEAVTSTAAVTPTTTVTWTPPAFSVTKPSTVTSSAMTLQPSEAAAATRTDTAVTSSAMNLQPAAAAAAAAVTWTPPAVTMTTPPAVSITKLTDTTTPATVAETPAAIMETSAAVTETSAPVPPTSGVTMTPIPVIESSSILDDSIQILDCVPQNKQLCITIDLESEEEEEDVTVLETILSGDNQKTTASTKAQKQPSDVNYVADFIAMVVNDRSTKKKSTESKVIKNNISKKKKSEVINDLVTRKTQNEIIRDMNELRRTKTDNKALNDRITEKKKKATEDINDHNNQKATDQSKVTKKNKKATEELVINDHTNKDATGNLAVTKKKKSSEGVIIHDHATKKKADPIAGPSTNALKKRNVTNDLSSSTGNHEVESLEILRGFRKKKTITIDGDPNDYTKENRITNDHSVTIGHVSKKNKTTIDPSTTITLDSSSSDKGTVITDQSTVPVVINEATNDSSSEDDMIMVQSLDVSDWSMVGCHRGCGAKFKSEKELNEHTAKGECRFWRRPSLK